MISAIKISRLDLLTAMVKSSISSRLHFNLKGIHYNLKKNIPHVGSLSLEHTQIPKLIDSLAESSLSHVILIKKQTIL